LAKTITIRDEVYERLLKMKRSEESFSDLFERLADTLDPLETLKRLRGSVEFRDKETMLEELSAARAERRP
jgi:predicted CopG family antitoxin